MCFADFDSLDWPALLVTLRWSRRAFRRNPDAAAQIRFPSGPLIAVPFRIRRCVRIPARLPIDLRRRSEATMVPLRSEEDLSPD